MKIRFTLIAGLLIIAMIAMQELMYAQGPGGPPPPGTTSAPLDPASWAFLAGGAFIAIKKKFFGKEEN